LYWWTSPTPVCSCKKQCMDLLAVGQPCKFSCFFAIGLAFHDFTFYFLFFLIKKETKKSRLAQGAFRHRLAFGFNLLRGGIIFPRSVRLFFPAAVVGLLLLLFCALLPGYGRKTPFRSWKNLRWWALRPKRFLTFFLFRFLLEILKSSFFTGGRI
jgi:hypothetical protein